MMKCIEVYEEWKKIGVGIYKDYGCLWLLGT